MPQPRTLPAQDEISEEDSLAVPVARPEKLAAQQRAFEDLMRHTGSVDFHPGFDADKGRWRETD